MEVANITQLDNQNTKHSHVMYREALQWRHYERDGVSNHQFLDCLLKRLFRRSSKKKSKFRVTGLSEGNPLATGGFLHKGPVKQKMFRLDDSIM